MSIACDKMIAEVQKLGVPKDLVIDQVICSNGNYTFTFKNRVFQLSACYSTTSIGFLYNFEVPCRWLQMYEPIGMSDIFNSLPTLFNRIDYLGALTLGDADEPLFRVIEENCRNLWPRVCFYYSHHKLKMFNGLTADKFFTFTIDHTNTVLMVTPIYPRTLATGRDFDLADPNLLDNLIDFLVSEWAQCSKSV